MSFLSDLIPAKARKWVYGIAALLALAYGIYQASDGDWRQAVPAFLGTLVAEMARANTNPPADGAK